MDLFPVCGKDSKQASSESHAILRIVIEKRQASKSSRVGCCKRYEPTKSWLRMASLKIKNSRDVRIRGTPNKARVRLRFDTGVTGPYESIEFELDAILALAVAEEIRNLIPPGNIPPPRRRARAIGKPKRKLLKT
jgi:hypothetical protein